MQITLRTFKFGTSIGMMSVVLALSGCTDDGTNYERDFGRDDPVIDSGDPRGEYDPPSITSPGTIELDEGGSTTVDLLEIIQDPDTPFDHLAIAHGMDHHEPVTGNHRRGVAGSALHLPYHSRTLCRK